jgi:hypothetical protein
MSTRVRERNTNTAEINTLFSDPVHVEIMEVLGREELSLRELSEVLGLDEKETVRALLPLVRNNIVAEHPKAATLLYFVAQPRFLKPAHILYKLWAEEVERPVSRPTLILEGGDVL